jgi:hypothetical protein
MAAVWRLEFQQRGAPHWHLLIHHVDPEEDDILRGEGEKTPVDRFREWWAAKYNPSKFGSFSGVRDMAKAGFYLACHHAKRDQGTWPSWYTGRAWGFIQEADFMQWVQVSEPATDITYWDMVWLHRIRKRFLRAKLSEDRRKAAEKGKPLPRWRKGREWRNFGFTWFLGQRHHAALLSLINDLQGIHLEDGCLPSRQAPSSGGPLGG